MKTDTSAQWDKFFNRYYIGDILALANEYPESRSLYVDFVNIEKFDPDLAEELLAHPDRILNTAEDALRSFDLPVKKTLTNAHLRITNIPQKIQIRDLRSIHISKLIAIEGLVRMATEVRPRLLVAAFECNGCGETMLVPQSSGRFVEPYMCKNEGCGRKGPFKIKLTESEFVDAQKLRVQESPEDMRGGEQPQTLDINIEDDIAGIVAPGDHVIVAGVLRSYQRITREGKSTFFDIILDSVSIETKDKEFTEIEISPEEEEEIIKLSKDPGIYKKIIASIAPSIYGYEEVKEALALQLMGGVPKNLPDGARIRGDLHVLLVGDPGIAKSQLLRYIRKLAPRGIYTSGRSSSAAGLCVSPDTRIQTSDGFFRIGEFVEARMQNPVQVEDGIWKSNCNSVSLSTVDSDHVITENPLVAVWRIRAPDTMMRIETEGGRSITVTPATPLPVMTDHGIGWVRSADLTDQQYLATPRLLPENSKVPYTIELFESNCTVSGASGLTARIVSLLKKRYGTIRDAASALEVSEDSLYYNWTNEDARGNPDLRTIMRLAEHAGIEFDEVAQSCCQFSQQHGHKITLPVTPDEDFMYFAGLIAGDGSISKAKHASGYGGSQIRFSNSDEHLLERYTSIITELFGIDCSRSDGSNVRPPDIRFGSKIIAEILHTLGVPASPKSSKISIPDVVLNLPNDLIAAYLRGLFDTDGSCTARQTGSPSLQLYTASKQLAEGVLLALLKFEIIGRIRVRPRDGAISSFVVDGEVRTITTSSDLYVLTIYGMENLTRYHDRIDFEHPLKHGNLVKILKSYKDRSRSTNVDRVPYMGSRLKAIRQHFGLPATIYSNNGNSTTTTISSSIGGSGSSGMAAERGVYMPTPQHLQSLLLCIKERIEADDWQGTRILLPRDLRDSARELLHKNTTNPELAQALNIPKTTSSEYFYRQSRDIAIPYRVLMRFSDLIQNFDRDTADAIRESMSDVVAKEPEMKAELDSLLQLSTGDVFFDKVRSTEEIRDHGYEHVYDLTISGTHNFVANSMLTHNTAAAVRDEFGDGRWTLEAGALVLADQGIAAIDEMDKMRSEDRSAIHEAMEQQTVSIAKAGIMATLKSRCALLGAANPKYGRFDPYEGIAQQIKMAPALLSRFDLIFVLKDEPDIGRDSAIASHILRAHHAGELHAHRTTVPGSGVTHSDVEGAMTIIKPEIMPDLLRKYIAYAKRGVYPIMESDAMDRLIEFYLGLRRQGEDRDSPVPVTARQLEALVRLCEASARMRLSYEVTIDDAKRVIRVVESCLRQVAFDAETGMLDADIITTGVSKSQRDKFKILRGIIRDIAAEHGGMASKDNIYAMAEEQGFDREHVEDMLKRLKTQGELYEPTQGNVRLS
ncbi:MAG: LAGLIDADG family homing endonuclease [Euryarchaeota archaeon]|nr:LAGLIDADG family homing endonuclease [Euryarchaeota archaeon]